ncbi:receptor protein-tyrosine kinase [Elysia marginata]|uniref:Receptor protein-tyrosine kinase n=1 Tax=Elysia marginata TaxID=1093978 RepID=A0AAV4JU15_9GAST|nr:receptor protein-tyrosine kinase [Elysia marginata]
MADHRSLSNNPWRCDCDLAPLIHFVQRIHSSSLRATVCASASLVNAARYSVSDKISNYRMADIPISDLQCPPATDCHGHGCKPCHKGLQKRLGEQCVCMEGTQPSFRIGSACEGERDDIPTRNPALPRKATFRYNVGFCPCVHSRKVVDVSTAGRGKIDKQTGEKGR